MKMTAFIVSILLSTTALAEDRANQYSNALSDTRVKILQLSEIIQDAKIQLKYEKNLSAEDKDELKVAIQEAQTAIDDTLESRLIQWYKRKETRGILSSLFREKGFGVLAEPNIQELVRLTIFMQRVPGDNDSGIIDHSIPVRDVEDI